MAIVLYCLLGTVYLIMIEILKKMDMVMPLELWGIAIGLIIGMILWMVFLTFIDWLSGFIWEDVEKL